MKITIEQLASTVEGELHGDGSAEIRSVNTIGQAGPGELSFVSDAKHHQLAAQSQATALLVEDLIDGFGGSQLLVANVQRALIDVLQMFAPVLEALPCGIDETAKIGHRVKLGTDAAIGPDVILHDGVEVGAGTIIDAACQIGENVKIGKNCRIDSNVVIYHHCRIGDNVVIQANSTIGSVGFGYVYIDGRHHLVPHNGIVVIEDEVEIGANTCVDRAKFGETRIGAGTKIDNLVQIGHNCRIGKGCLIAGQVGLAGSVTMGDGVVLGGQVGVRDNVRIGDGAIVAAKGGVMAGEVPAGAVLVGTPAEESRTQFRMLSCMRRLPELFRQMKDVVARIKKLEASEDDKK